MKASAIIGRIWRALTRFQAHFFAALMLAAMAAAAFVSPASAETRTLKLYFVHTKERAEITYKKNGRYVPSGLKEVNRFLRDWRRNEPTKMDPKLLDLVWDVYKKSGSRDYIHVISAYRSPATNDMLRKRGRGVATKSQHMLGKAMDFYLPDVKLAELRRIGLGMHGGGVGYYPSSGSPFVHLDVGNVRHWPRMNRSQLMAMFPDGKTLHVPSDGKPLPGYDQAMASVKRKKSGGSVAVASAAADDDDKPQRTGGFLTAFFSGGADEEEDRDGRNFRPAVKPDAEIPVQKKDAEIPVQKETAPVVAETEKPADTPAVIMASLSPKKVPVPLFAPRAEPEPVVAAETEIAKPDPVVEEAVVVAMAAPLPTPRPLEAIEAAERMGVTDEKTNLNIVADSEIRTGKQLAMAGPDGLAEARAILKKAIAEENSSVADFAVPMPRPDEADADIPVVMAALPVSGPIVGSVPRVDRTVQDDKKIRKSSRVTASDASGKDLNGRLSPATLRQIVLASAEGPAGLDALRIGAKTTGKSAKPSARDARPDPKPMIVPLPRHVSHRAFDKRLITETTIETQAPSFVAKLGGGVPTEVYTAGFRMTLPAEDPNRFTGKAVQFLSVAKFN